MAARRVLKFVIFILSAPFIAFSWVAELCDIRGIQSDIKKCLEVIDTTSHKVPLPFIMSLIAAEDHRSALHNGVDPIAIVRAVYVRILYGKIQGASTIEQQFVRVVSGRFERTVGRKVREQLLAIAISRRRSKHHIASAYLSVAFYGSGCVGVVGLRSCCGNNLTCAMPNDIFGMIARLKYPEPLKPTLSWKMKFHQRVEHISYRGGRPANKFIQQTAKSVAPFAKKRKSPATFASG